MTTIKRSYTLPALAILLAGLILAPALAQSRNALRQKPKPQDPARQKTMAMVNGEPITRQELAQECLRHYGEDVLESLINKRLLEQACTKENIKISEKDIDAEVARMAKRFDIPVDQWYKMILNERGITPEQYRDMIWMILAQKKLAGNRIKITREELLREFETQCGPAVKARLIAVEKPELAQQIRAKAVANPDSFAKLAKQYSVDTVSASSKGWIPPIRRHSTDQKIEDTAFSLKDGQISQVISFPEIKQYIILKRESLIPAQKIPFEEAAPKLQEFLEQKKLGKAGHKIAKDLQDRARIANYFKKPSPQDPDTAAVLNGKKISFDDLAEECIRRHGIEALEGTISRRLLIQACKKANISILENDIRQEITRTALLSLPPKKDGSADIEKWMELATKEQGVSKEVYIRDSVWPSVALKKLVGKSVHVDEKDIQKGYEANYGPRVKCMMIALDNYRRATHVWGLAQKNPTPKNFGDLAEQYSIDPTSRKLRGEIPPLRKYNGHPALKRIEEEAFALKEGELSSIINVKDEDKSDKYVILLCLGKTEPMNVDPQEARKLIYKDLFEKKQRVAMSKFFKTLLNTATIDNYLTGESRAPKQGPSPSLKPVKYR